MVAKQRTMHVTFWSQTYLKFSLLYSFIKSIVHVYNDSIQFLLKSFYVYSF